MTEPCNSRLTITLVFILAACTITAQEPSARLLSELPKEKQTKLGLYLTAKEAHEKWKAEPNKVTKLDVRTPEEFVFVGHRGRVETAQLGQASPGDVT